MEPMKKLLEKLVWYLKYTIHMVVLRVGEDHHLAASKKSGCFENLEQRGIHPDTTDIAERI